MNLGMILPRGKSKEETQNAWSRILSFLSIAPLPIEIKRIQLHENIHLIVCNIPSCCGNAMHNNRLNRRVKRKLDRVFSNEGVLSVIEHPMINQLYGSNKTRYEPYLKDIAVERFSELLGLVHRGSGLNRIELTITGSSRHLEYAITQLITAVKTINVLIPEGSEEPEQVEKAFEETGIPVHITTDPEVLKRTTLWVRFPNDHESFDNLTGIYKGRIIDLGALKVIDTRMKRIYNICLELPDAFLSQIGTLPEELRCFRLPGFLTANCANAWRESPSEASIRLDMRLSVKP